MRLLGLGMVIPLMLAAPLRADAAVFHCAGGDVRCLIGAIRAANANGEPDAITLGAGTYRLADVVDDADGANGLPSITSHIVLTGSGPDSTLIRREAAATAFRILHVASGGRLVLHHVAILGGRAAGETSASQRGGGIFNRGNLTVSGSRISGNTADLGGGGIHTAMGELIVYASTVDDNVAGSFAGGIENIQGGTWIESSTIAHNFATLETGGLGNNEARMVIRNSTITGNSSDQFGAVTADDDCTVIIESSTITANAARSIGGIAVARGGNRVTLRGTLIAGNVGRDCAPGGEILSLGSNLVGAGTGCPSDGPGDRTVDRGDVFTTVLGPLADNGGPTRTQALLPGSPAIDSVDANCPPPRTDQRGTPRPVGTACDIGAFEFRAKPTRTVDIDVKPGNEHNVINPHARGGIWVAVLSDADPGDPFEPASQVDIPTVEFGPGAASPIRHVARDLDGDGLGDLLLRFGIPESSIACGDTEVTLKGKTSDGHRFTGTDSIRTTGCER